MFSYSTTALGFALLIASGVLMGLHWRGWQAAQATDMEAEEERRFAWRQFRRRMQASGMIGLVGLGMLLGQFLRAPLMIVFFWTAIMLLLVWVVLLALVDALATRQHYGQVRRRNLSDHARAQADLRRQFERHHDGEAHDSPL